MNETAPILLALISFVTALSSSTSAAPLSISLGQFFPGNALFLVLRFPSHTERGYCSRVLDLRHRFTIPLSHD